MKKRRNDSTRVQLSAGPTDVQIKEYFETRYGRVKGLVLMSTTQMCLLNATWKPETLPSLRSGGAAEPSTKPIAEDNGGAIYG